MARIEIKPRNVKCTSFLWKKLCNERKKRKGEIVRRVGCLLRLGLVGSVESYTDVCV